MCLINHVLDIRHVLLITNLDISSSFRLFRLFRLFRNLSLFSFFERLADLFVGVTGAEQEHEFDAGLVARQHAAEK